MITPPQNPANDTEKMKLIGEMASAMAHEINNPLSIIRSKTTLLSMKLERENISKEELAQYLSDIEVTALRIERIVKSTMYFSKGIKPELFQVITPRHIYEQVQSVLLSQLKNKGFSLSFLENSEDASFKGNLVQIVQVFLNLINLAAETLENSDKKEIIFESKIADSHLVLLVSAPGSASKCEREHKLRLTLSKGIVENHLGSLNLNISPLGETIYQTHLPLI